MLLPLAFLHQILARRTATHRPPRFRVLTLDPKFSEVTDGSNHRSIQPRARCRTGPQSQYRNTGIPADKVTLLTPGTVDQVDKEIRNPYPLTATEQPGMGNAIGALLGGGVGITGGALLVALIPGRRSDDCARAARCRQSGRCRSDRWRHGWR